MFDSDISGFDETQSAIDGMTGNVVAATEAGGMEEAEELLDKIKETAPVETGEYKNDWHIEKRPEDPRGDIFIVNTTEHGPYLVYPNSKMVGSEKADVPSQGIMHNVRGIVARHRKGYKDRVAEFIKDALGF